MKKQNKQYTMKKSIILMGVAVMALASCAKDGVKEVNNGRAIDFRVATQTRATETTTANLSTFYVTAIDAKGSNYFTNAAFTKIEEYFSSSPAYYWPGDGSNLNFYAYAPAAETLGATVTINKTTKTLAGFSPAAEFADQKDFVTATATGSKANETTGVALTFDHQLTQIEVKARNANEAYVYKIKGVRIAQPLSKANFDFTTKQWTPGTDKAIYQVQYSNEITLNTYGQCIMETEGDNAMLIPQQLVAWDAENDKANADEGAYLSVYAQVETKDGARVYPKEDGMDYAWLAVPIDTKWEAGYKYVYTLDFTNGAGYPDPLDNPLGNGPVLGGPIKFTMDVNPWGEKATMEATENMMIGKWAAARVEVQWTYSDGSISRSILDKTEEVHDWLNEQFWFIEILSETEYLIFAGTENEQTCGFHIIDNHMFIDYFYNPTTGEYNSDMFIRNITEDFAVFSERISYNNGTIRDAVYYYARVR